MKQVTALSLIPFCFGPAFPFPMRPKARKNPADCAGTFSPIFFIKSAGFFRGNMRE